MIKKTGSTEKITHMLIKEEDENKSKKTASKKGYTWKKLIGELIDSSSSQGVRG